MQRRFSATIALFAISTVCSLLLLAQKRACNDREFLARLTELERSLADADVNWRNTFGETHLHLAAKKQDVKQIERLINAGHNVNNGDHGNFTPLAEAVNYGYFENARLLLNRGADPNIASTQPLVDGRPVSSGAKISNARFFPIITHLTMIVE